MASVAAPVTTLLLQAPLPDLVQSCVIAPPLEPSPVDDPDAPFAPLPPGVSLDDVAVIGEEQLIDTSPDQLIGCIIDTEDNPQGRLNALFPDAEAGDGVIERSTSHFWVYDGSEWNDVGPNPGPRLIITSILSPINEIFVVSAPTRTKIRVTSLAYALQLLTEPDPLVVRTRLDAAAITAVKAPSSGTTLNALLPLVSISATVFAPAADSTIAALAPAVISRLAINTPTTNITLSGIPPDLVGQFRVRVNPPVLAFELQAIAPSVSTGVAISPAAVTIGLSVNPVLIEAALYEVFLSSGTWDWTAAGSPSTVDVLLVAGGGGGGSRQGGGGGAGGVRIAEGVSVSDNVTVTIGAGGTGGTSGGRGANGSNTSFGSESATGGGGGGGRTTDNEGSSGGSGGGGGGQNALGGSGAAGQGSSGGISNVSVSNSGGGGGGKSESGQNAFDTADQALNKAGDGGDGITLASIGWNDAVAIGAPAAVGGGGGGACFGNTTGFGVGGLGGGADGIAGDDPNGSVAGNPGTANTGGGGGGSFLANDQGGAGGSGLVIVRWKL